MSDDEWSLCRMAAQAPYPAYASVRRLDKRGYRAIQSLYRTAAQAPYPAYASGPSTG